MKRARDYLALCNADDGKVEKLIENLQSIVDGQCKMRDSDFCVIMWMSILGLLVSYASLPIAGPGAAAFSSESMLAIAWRHDQSSSHSAITAPTSLIIDCCSIFSLDTA